MLKMKQNIVKRNMIVLNNNFSIQKYNFPFDHYIIDNFFLEEVADKVGKDFPDTDDDGWFSYKNPLENKKTIQNWGKFPKNTYQTFQYFCSESFISVIKEITGIKTLYPDYGLHGGGWHMHGRGGNLNVHKDYSIHPKLGLQRKLNLIVYMSKGWNPEWGRGGRRLWRRYFPLPTLHCLRRWRPQRRRDRPRLRWVLPCLPELRGWHPEPG